jgi:hypothetical protein
LSLPDRSAAKFLDRALFSATTRKLTIIVSWILVGIIIIDMLSSRQTTLKFDEDLETIYFILTIVIGWGIASWLILGYANKTTTDLRGRSKLVGIIHGAVTVLQFALLGFFVFILANRNYEDLTWYANAITSVAATAIMLLFSAKFMHWYVSYHKNILLLFYTLAAASLAVTVATDYGAKQAFLQVVVEPSDPGATPAETYPIKNTEQGRIIKRDVGTTMTTTHFVPPQYVDAYHYLHQLPSTASFVFSWAATAMTLRYYHHKTGRITFWFLISLILALYVVGRGPDILKNFEGTFLDFEKPEWVNYIYRAGTVGGNVMFGIAFFMMGRRIAPIRDYLYIAAVGFTIVGFAHVSNALQFTFGATSHSLVMLSSYLFSVGLYGAAISISQDTKLRQAIRKSAREECVLLDSIGKAQVEQEIEKKVIMMAKSQQNSMADETGVRPSLKEEEMKSYVEKVMEEIKAAENTSSKVSTA